MRTAKLLLLAGTLSLPILARAEESSLIWVEGESAAPFGPCGEGSVASPRTGRSNRWRSLQKREESPRMRCRTPGVMISFLTGRLETQRGEGFPVFIASLHIDRGILSR